MEIDKRVGILTFHTADNYGAVLQTYALQSAVEEMGCKDVEIIDFNTKVHEREYSIFKKESSNPIKNVILQAITLLLYPQLRTRKNRFKKFRQQLLHLSKTRYTDSEDLKRDLCFKDVYISGSDQVFNPYVKYSDVYYLGFEKHGCKKIAYAPSFGIAEFPDEVMASLLPLIHDFDALSCRETEGAKYLSNVVKKDVPTVLDPVFLLSKESWLKIANRPKVKGKYIFVYDLNGGENLITIAKYFKNKYHLPIVCATTNIRKNYHVDQQLYSVGPQELLGFINDAEYVVTDSFHGTALSAIMRTKFYSYIAAKKTSSRITSILNQLDIDNQIIYDVTGLEKLQEPSLNYVGLLDDLIESSKEWLKENL